MKILITTSSFGKANPEPLEQMRAQGLDIVLNPHGRKLTEDEVAELLQEHRPVAMIAGVEPLTAAVLEKAPYLKIVSRCGIGLDSVDLDAASRLGITVTNTPDAPTIPVAELTMGMILVLLRGLRITDASIRAGGWQRPMGTLLHGKTVGLVGCGRIGSRLARMLLPFECDVLGVDPALSEHETIRLVELDELLAGADVVSLHLPYAPQTHHFMDVARLAAMKRGAILINAARGGLVDEDALYESLRSEHLAGAALDCYEHEPYTGKLRELDNVLLTAHIGSYAQEGRVMMEAQAVENLVHAMQELGLRA